jgi:hypothetical protein
MLKSVLLTIDDLADLKTLRLEIERRALSAKKRISAAANSFCKTGGPYFDDSVREPERLLATLNKIISATEDDFSKVAFDNLCAKILGELESRPVQKYKTLEDVWLNDPYVQRAIASGEASPESVIVELANQKNELLRNVIKLEAIAPKRFGNLVWHCPDDLIPLT